MICPQFYDAMCFSQWPYKWWHPKNDFILVAWVSCGGHFKHNHHLPWHWPLVVAVQEKQSHDLLLLMLWWWPWNVESNDFFRAKRDIRTGMDFSQRCCHSSFPIFRFNVKTREVGTRLHGFPRPKQEISLLDMDRKPDFPQNFPLVHFSENPLNGSGLETHFLNDWLLLTLSNDNLEKIPISVLMSNLENSFSNRELLRDDYQWQRIKDVNQKVFLRIRSWNSTFNR